MRKKFCPSLKGLVSLTDIMTEMLVKPRMNKTSFKKEKKSPFSAKHKQNQKKNLMIEGKKTLTNHNETTKKYKKKCCCVAIWWDGLLQSKIIGKIDCVQSNKTKKIPAWL